MNEKSPNFKVEIPALAVVKPVRKGRKALKSSLGAYYTSFHILGQLVSLVMGGLTLYYYIENDNNEHYAITNLRMLIGTPENGYLPQADEQQYFIISALACFTLSSLLQLSVVWRAYFSPIFLAKNPSLSVNNNQHKNYHFINSFYLFV